MKSRFTRYFGANVARKFYLVCVAFIAIGFVIGYLYWWYFAAPFLVLGTAGFLVSYGIQVSDKDIDEHIEKTVEDFKKSIEASFAKTARPVLKRARTESSAQASILSPQFLPKERISRYSPQNMISSPKKPPRIPLSPQRAQTALK